MLVRELNKSMVSAGSMAATITSSDFVIENLFKASVKAVVSAGSSPLGTIKLQTTDDQVTYYDVVGSQFDVNTDSTSKFRWNLTEITDGFLRVVYTRTSGTATLNVTINGSTFT